MKGSPKQDQIRALREGAQQPRAYRVGDTVVMPDGEARTVTAVVVPKPRRKPPTAKATVVPWLAREGDCASCDKRRAALQETMRKRRERRSPK